MTPFSLLVKPAGPDCNLDCSYCFYRRAADTLPECGFSRMPEEALETMLRKYLGLGFRNAVFGWQGGEPALAGLDFFRRVTELQERFASPGTVIGNGFQTNGTLIDPEWARFLSEKRFLVGLSLDGPREIHDKYRKDISGSGSWVSVMSAAEHLRSARAEFNILCLVTDANAEQPDEVWDFFRSSGFRHLQFIPCFETDKIKGGLKSFALRPVQWTGFLKRTFDLWYNGGHPEVSVRFFDSCLAYFARHPAPDCEGLPRCSSYLLIERNGDVYPCDFFVRPEWRIGNVLETDFASLRRHPTALKFAGLKGETSRACGSCDLLGLCAGGCTRFRMFGSASARNLNYYCESVKEFFVHAGDRLRSLARRLG
jgi:uncharacterized protein